MSRTTVRALRLDVLHPRSVLAMAAGRWRSELYHGGVGSPLRLVAVPAPTHPGRVGARPSLVVRDRRIGPQDVVLGGFSPTLTALTGLPRRTIPGHEIVGHVLEAPSRRRPPDPTFTR